MIPSKLILQTRNCAFWFVRAPCGYDADEGGRAARGTATALDRPGRGLERRPARQSIIDTIGHRPVTKPAPRRNSFLAVTQEPQSFAELIGPHLPQLYRLAYRLTRTVADAEDLLQDVLVTLYERRGELDSIDSLSIWASRVLYNRFVDQARRYARRRMESLTARADLEPATGPGANADDVLDIRRVQTAIEQLSREHREVLLLHDAEDYKLIEIQQITGVPVGTLKSRLHRARARLRGLLGDGGTF